MEIIKKKKRSGRRTEKKDPKKEARFKELSKELTDQGYQVRREELKRGLGWRVTSGACRVEKERLIFVDRRLSQADQVEFLEEILREVGAKTPISEGSLSSPSS
jgi:hypothetical protein